MKSESEVQQEIMMTGPVYHCLLLRNNSGALKDEQGRLVRFGLGNTSSQQNKISKSTDLIGIKTVVITQEMVGKMIGIFTACEVKAENWKPSEKDQRYVAQRNFIDLVKARGGIGFFAKSKQEFIDYMSSLR